MENVEDQSCLSKGSQEYFETICEPCNDSDNVHVKAEGYCVTCKEYICKGCIQSHKRLKLLKDHQIQRLDEMLTLTHSQNTKESLTSSDEEIKIECKEHKGEYIRYFCKTHTVVCCVDCVTLSHRLCTDVVRVAVASDESSVETELEEFNRRLKNVAEGVQTLIQIAEKNHLKVEDQMVKLLQDIGKYKETILETLDNLAKEIETLLRSKINEEQEKIEQLVRRCKLLQEDVERTSNEFKNLKGNKRNDIEFIRMNQSKLQLAEWEKERNDLNVITKATQYEFCPNPDVIHAVRKISVLGHVMEKDDAEQCIDCKTMSIKKYIRNLSCGHNICEVCKEESTKDLNSTANGEHKYYCKICDAAVDISTTSVLAGGDDVCFPNKKTEEMVPRPNSGSTDHCKICKAVVDNGIKSALACGHDVCLSCNKLGRAIQCTDCGLITVKCKRCRSAVDNNYTSVLACGHGVCLPCRKQRKMAPCTECGLITGNQPPGSLDEYSDEECEAPIDELEFNFPGGIQAPYHPHPGKPFRGGKVTFRLRTCDGDVYDMLKLAFDRKLICRIEKGKIKSNFKLYNGDIVEDWHAQGFSYNREPTDEYEEYIENLKDRLQEFGIQS